MKIEIDTTDQTEYINSCNIGTRHFINCYSEFRACMLASLTTLAIYKNTVYDKGIAGMSVEEVDKIMSDFEAYY